MPSQKRPQDFDAQVIALARLALAAAPYDAASAVRRAARAAIAEGHSVGTELAELLQSASSRAARPQPLTAAAPVDKDSHLSLVSVDSPVTLPAEPVFVPRLASALAQVVDEHRNKGRLLESGLAPIRTILFTGPPGVGKTLAARWIASELDLPLVTLDLASVMSSLLGQTGANVRNAIEFAKKGACVLLLDELDAVAKRRDDNTEIGELKRLVTVLLQEIDRWPAGSLLIGATNHKDLLDPAVWRRFEQVVAFPYPDVNAVRAALSNLLPSGEYSPNVATGLAGTFAGRSLSELASFVSRCQRQSALRGTTLDDSISRNLAEHFSELPRSERVERASALASSTTLSQRAVSELTGVSRDTIRRHAASDGTKQASR